MKSIKDLREQYQVITEKEDKEQRKLTALVRAGLFDAKKLPVLKRALDKGVDKMTAAEKKILIELLDSLMNQVVSNEPVYMKVKRNVQSMDEEIIAEAVKTPVTIADVPSIVVLKRKAVRVYPGGQQVGLYYSQQLDKYVTIPFGEAGIAEEVDLNEAKRRRFDTWRADDDNDIEADRAYRKPYERLTAKERELVRPGRVFGRGVASGQPLPLTLVQTALAAYWKRKNKNTPPAAPSKKKTKAKQAAPQAAPQTTPAAATTPPAKKAKRQNKKQTKSTKQATAGLKMRSPAAAARRAAQVRRKNPNAQSLSPGAQAYINKGNVKESFRERLNMIREERHHIEEGKVRDFSIGDIDDVSVGSIAKDLTPGLGTARAAVRTKRDWQKGNYGSAALNALDTGLSGISDAALASGIFAPVGGAIKGVVGGIKGASAGLRAYRTYKAAKKAKKIQKIVSKGGKITDPKILARRRRTLQRMNKVKSKRGNIFRRAGDVALGAAAGGSLFGGGGDGNNSSSYKTPVTAREYQPSQTKIVAPEYKGARSSVDVQDYIRNKRFTQAGTSTRPVQETVEVNLDGNLFEINNNIADKLITVYESLNDTNKQKMIDMMMNESTQDKIVGFITRY